jgi:hypothetical protein
MRGRITRERVTVGNDGTVGAAAAYPLRVRRGVAGKAWALRGREIFYVESPGACREGEGGGAGALAREQEQLRWYSYSLQRCTARGCP